MCKLKIHPFPRYSNDKYSTYITEQKKVVSTFDCERTGFSEYHYSLRLKLIDVLCMQSAGDN
jgi:hypothetical protein